MDPNTGLAFLQDMSLNGTMLNGKRMERGSTKVLRNQDIIEIRLTGFYVIYCDKKSTGKQLLEIGDGYYLTDTELGRGSHAMVRLAICKNTGERVACKIIDRLTSKCPTNVIWSVKQEVAILKQLKHASDFLYNHVIIHHISLISFKFWTLWKRMMCNSM